MARERKRERSLAKARALARARAAGLAEFHALHGAGHNKLENFLNAFDRVDGAEAEPSAVEDLIDQMRWVADAFRGYLQHEYRSLDQAFDVRRPKSYRQPAARKRALLMRRVQEEGRELRLHGCTVGDAMFQFLATRHGTNKTDAGAWYLAKYKGLMPDPTKSMDDLQDWVREALRYER